MLRYLATDFADVGVLIPTASAVDIIYCIVSIVRHVPISQLWLLLLASPCSAATSDTVCDCCLAIAMAIVVISLHSCCSIIINNDNTSSIKAIANTTSFPSLHQPDILPLSASATRPFLLCIAWMYFALSSFACMSLLMKGCWLLIRDLTWSCCLLPWSTFPFCDRNYRSAFCCFVVVCVSWLSLPLSLSGCVPVVVAAILFCMQHLERRTCWQCSC